jgi:hypothetical protein
MSDNHEEIESIPWSTLMEDARPDRSRLVYAAAGALILFAVAALVARSLWKPDVAATVPVAAPTAPTTQPATPEPPQAAAASITEADLMATIDNESSRAAAAFAEWFVYDYFTVDGDPANLVTLQAALPPGAPEELLPHGTTDVVTYVEWARAARVTEVSPGRFEVLVLFRSISAPPGEDFERHHTRAVIVPMDISGAGGLRLTDLPSPAAIPQRPAVASWERPVGPGNPSVAGAAMGFSWGGLDTEFEGLGAQKEGDTWRTLVLNHLPGGTGWPFVIAFPDAFVQE